MPKFFDEDGNLVGNCPRRILERIGIDPASLDERMTQQEARDLSRKDIFRQRDLSSLVGDLADLLGILVHMVADHIEATEQELPGMRDRIGPALDLAARIQAQRAKSELPYQVKGPPEQTLGKILQNGNDIAQILRKNRPADPS